jgi:hypothetical protein
MLFVGFMASTPTLDRESASTLDPTVCARKCECECESLPRREKAVEADLVQIANRGHQAHDIVHLGS